MFNFARHYHILKTIIPFSLSSGMVCIGCSTFTSRDSCIRVEFGEECSDDLLTVNGLNSWEIVSFLPCQLALYLYSRCLDFVLGSRSLGVSYERHITIS